MISKDLLEISSGRASEEKASFNLSRAPVESFGFQRLKKSPQGK